MWGAVIKLNIFVYTCMSIYDILNIAASGNLDDIFIEERSGIMYLYWLRNGHLGLNSHQGIFPEEVMYLFRDIFVTTH
jgi:hypothetical protein